MKTLVQVVENTPSIEVIEGATALSLLAENDQMKGVVVSVDHSEPFVMQAKTYLLAAGGAGSLYKKTTNPPSVRGLALGMAARAGARIADAEFVQFHPTAIDLDLDPAPLATEALRGEGATLVNKDGHRYMQDIHKDAELAPRDIVARANFREHQKGNRPALDTRDAIGNHIIEEFPSVSQACLTAGIDPVKDTIPIVPAAHYHMGGVATDKTGMSSIKGLWVAGEASSTGLHGANRLASNGLLEALVYAATCADGMIKLITSDGGMQYNPNIAVDEMGFAQANATAVEKLRNTMSDNVGVIRDAKGLKRALGIMRELEAEYGGVSTNFDNMISAATLITAAALKREESRGGHFRTDFPNAVDTFGKRAEISLAEATEIRDREGS